MKDDKGIQRDRHFKKYDEDNNEFTAFDLKEENDEGYFDENNFYFNYKEKDDPWYESVKDEARETELLNKKTKRTKDRNTNNNNKDNGNKSEGSLSQITNEKKEEEKDISKYGDEDLYYIEEQVTDEEANVIKTQIKENRLLLVNILKSDKETVNQAIKRLRPVISNEQGKGKGKRKGNGNSTKDDNTIEAKANFKPDTSSFDTLLSIVSKLTELSYFDVYFDSINAIIRDYGENSIIKWKYKTISMNDKTEEVYGDFTMDEMIEWNKKNFFEDTDSIKFVFCPIDPRDKLNCDTHNKEGEGEVWFDKKDTLYKIYFN